jgi:hypothetical protein
VRAARWRCRRPSVRRSCGEVSGQLALGTPIGDTDCLGYGIELAKRREVTLRLAHTSGFDLVLDDVTVVRVPAGRIRIEGTRAWRSVDPAIVTDGLELADAGELFPADRASQLVLLPGDRVELAGDLEHAPDATVPGNYRQMASVLVPRGVPRIRVVGR